MGAVQKIAVLTSGGDSQGMNAAVRAVVRSALFRGLEVYGVQRGYQGLLNEDLRQMDLRSVGDIIQRGGTILQTARCKEFLTPEGQQRGADVLRKHGIDGLVVIGGDGSYQGANKLSKLGIKTMGLPGTIDNDIPFTDFTIGFDTATSIVVDAINKLRDTMTSHERSSVVEVMGRHCGDIALYAGLASGAESILVPEVPFDIREISQRMRENFQNGKRHSIVIVAEGVCGGDEIARQITEHSGIEPRVTVLGHIQRGGSPTHNDRILASRLGDFAVERLEAGDSAKACGIVKGQLVTTDIDTVVSTKKSFDMDLYNLAIRLAQ
ncbi:6-phosphofructokinase [Cohnella ginsengisoli]|uniref:ATP-dependent 6-phosphofructokinase n=1 Tax=Cohnella ginsengisoli TaxID=425004 RepID=A0A9X4KHC9_9BACL|nr:6-phosphofructokinase [Cohnella ginsengisoli]MDG0790127.1 6-phosphofructokinase [Cohnella ginsengisoli]